MSDTNSQSEVSEGDLSDLPEVLLSTELDAIVKYDETYHRDGRALIYYERAVLITTYQHGYKNGIGYILYDDEMICIVEFQNDCAISCTKVDSTKTTVTNTELHLSFDGQVMDGVPMGFGTCIDTNTESKVYEGTMIGWKRMGYGTSYSNDRKIYQGDFLDDKRCGIGKSFDDHGVIFRQGYWYNDEWKPTNLICIDPVDPLLRSLVLDSSNDPEILNLTGFQTAEEIRVKKDKFETVNVVTISNLRNLRRLHFEESSCTMVGYSRPDRRLCVSDCPSLESIVMEKYCFSDYSLFELSHLDSLQSLVIGSFGVFSFNFYGASFTLQGLDSRRLAE